MRVRIRNPSSGIFKALNPNPGWKNSDLGSGINIPDPQHCTNNSPVWKTQVSHLRGCHHIAVSYICTVRFTHTLLPYAYRKTRYPTANTLALKVVYFPSRAGGIQRCPPIAPPMRPLAIARTPQLPLISALSTGTHRYGTIVNWKFVSRGDCE